MAKIVYDNKALNGDIISYSIVMKNVMSSATKAEQGALFNKPK